MFVHSVYFWLRPELSEADIQKFQSGIESLRTLETVRQGFIGTPAATDRPVIDRSYSFALIVHFDDVAGHDVYQEHPVHEKFRQECSPLWTRVQIYDCMAD